MLRFELLPGWRLWLSWLRLRYWQDCGKPKPGSKSVRWKAELKKPQPPASQICGSSWISPPA